MCLQKCFPTIKAFLNSLAHIILYNTLHNKLQLLQMWNYKCAKRSVDILFPFFLTCFNKKKTTEPFKELEIFIIF